MCDVTFREIAWGSPEYRTELRLRDEILRQPLGLSLQSEDLGEERTQQHFGIFGESGTLVACVVAIPLTSTDVRIRQMAVAASHQSRGVGRQLMDELEANLQSRGFRRLVLNARTTAVGFYEKLGYTVVGDEFVSVTVPHVRMEKVMS
jgi:ribosomal protein S18 acetylase RimI-like enzyme